MTTEVVTETATLRIGTRKGCWTLTGDAGRQAWSASEPAYLGHIVQHVLADPREPRRVLMAASTGHLGPTIFHSDDGGESWTESTRPPAFRAGDAHGRAVKTVFWLAPGPSDESGSWYAGASPQGLFHSDDHGVTWSP